MLSKPFSNKAEVKDVDGYVLYFGRPI